MNKFTEYISKNNRVLWIIFSMYALLIFLLCLIFHIEIYRGVLISSLWRKPISFWGFWLPKISVSLFLASFVFFSKRNWWTIVIALFLNLWCLANTIYFRSRGLLFDGFTFTMASNMDGFWGSLIMYFLPKDIIPFLLTVIYAVLLILINNKVPYTINLKVGSCAVLISFIFSWYSLATTNHFFTNYAYEMSDQRPPKHTNIYYMKKNPFSYNYRMSLMPMTNMSYGFEHFSAVHGFVYVMLDYLHNKNSMEHPYQLSEQEVVEIQKFLGTSPDINYDKPLIIFIVESLENWAVNENIMPHLYKCMQTHHHLYATNVKPQVRVGTSADGQMIINTGILPVEVGATCFRFQYNVFPSLVNRQDSAACVLTHETKVWNQEVMSKAYGYSITDGSTSVSDSLLAIRMLHYIRNDYKTVMGITVRSHAPFTDGIYSTLSMPKQMPNEMSNYLKCINLADEGMALILDSIKLIPQLENAVIVITGDHNIFYKEKRDEFYKYCKKYNDDFDVLQGNCPLIIISDDLDSTINIEDEVYQMDIYPTLLAITNNQNYYWQGFGVNLLEPNNIYNRPISEKEASILSEKIITSNFFSTTILNGK